MKASKLSFYEHSPFEFPHEPKCTAPEGACGVVHLSLYFSLQALCDFVLFGVIFGLHLR